MNNFPKWQNQDNSNKHRILALVIGALIFPITIPVFLIVVLPHIDNYFSISSFFYGSGNIIIGIIAIIIGGVVAIWTIVIQITLASGTPFPMLPTKKLLIAGPFQYCRNPMTLGTIVAYAGIAILIGSFTALVAVAIFAAILLGYLKIIEEKELEMRFGSEYIEYKKKTPFIIPIKMDQANKHTNLSVAIVSESEAKSVPYPYVYVNDDGTVRELHQSERTYLETPFHPFDGAQPYIKSSYSKKDGRGRIGGFCHRSNIPSNIDILGAPLEDPSEVSRKMFLEKQIKSAKENGKK